MGSLGVNPQEEKWVLWGARLETRPESSGVTCRGAGPHVTPWGAVVCPLPWLLLFGKEAEGAVLLAVSRGVCAGGRDVLSSQRGRAGGRLVALLALPRDVFPTKAGVLAQQEAGSGAWK